MSEWRDVPGLPGLQVSDHGFARTLTRVIRAVHGREWVAKGQLLSAVYAGHGYRSIRFEHKTYKIANLIALAFLGPKPSPLHQVRHLNDDKSNDRLSNLAYGTKTENQSDRVVNGVLVCGEAHPNAKLNAASVRLIKQRLRSGESCTTIARDYPVHPATIGEIQSGRNWKHVQ